MGTQAPRALSVDENNYAGWENIFQACEAATPHATSASLFTACVADELCAAMGAVGASCGELFAAVEEEYSGGQERSLRGRTDEDAMQLRRRKLGNKVMFSFGG